MLSVLCVLTVTGCAVLQGQQQRMAEKLIRLHVVANSDAAEDQYIKLVVRDAVLAEAGNLLADASDARAAIAGGLPQLEAAANAALRAEGSADTARVSFRRELFPTRVYSTFSLPAGVYPSLRVTLGEGNGHNWWCVIFPSLCTPATADGFAAAAAAGGFSQAEIALMTQADEGYSVKFRSLELLQALKTRLFGE